MARRYDSRTTTFSPEGRLYQVEYALEAINNASSTIGILAKDGVVLAADRAVTSKLLDPGNEKEKLYIIDDHIVGATAGWTADAHVLTNYARVTAQRHRFSFDEPQPIESLVVRLCDTKQSYTQFGGLRPFGVALLIAGWDADLGFQLYHTDPAGNYLGWRATSIGQNSATANAVLRTEWNEDLDLEGAKKLAASVLLKTVDSAGATPGRLEFAVVYRENERTVIKILPDQEIDALIKQCQKEQQDKEKKENESRTMG